MTKQAEADLTLDGHASVGEDGARYTGSGGRDGSEAIVLAIVASMGGAMLGLLLAGQVELLVWFFVAALMGGYAGWSARRMVTGP